MHVVYFNPHLDGAGRAAAELLAAWPTLVDVPLAIARAGADVTVIQAAHCHERCERDGVAYRFVDARHDGAARLAAATAAERPDVVHCNGLAFPSHIIALSNALPDTPLLVQDHKDALPRPWRRAHWRRALERVAGIAFTASAQAQPFVRAGVLPAGVPVFAIPESSSRFTPGDATAARAALGVTGAPVVACISRLVPDKDPLTVLHGFAHAVPQLPGARLWLCHDDGPLFDRVRAAIAADDTLRGRVHLLHRLPHHQIELLLRAADVYVSASRWEGSGYALIEALACGTTPIASDIAPHRALLGDGAAGRLFPCGAAPALADALIAETRAPAGRSEVRAHFDAHLSLEAVGRRLLAACEELRRPRPSPLRRRLRVALVVPGGVDRSGVQRVIPCLLWLIERLARSVELHVIALRQEPAACTYELLGATVHCLPAGASRIRTLHILHALQRAYRFDVLHALWMHPQGTLAGAVGSLSGTPVLLHMTGGDLAAIADIGFGGRSRRRGRVWLRAATYAATHIIVSSPLLQRSAAELGIEAELLPFGVALDRWPACAPRRRDPAAPARLLHVGTINRVKDHATLLRALAILRASGVAFHADLIGEDTLDGAAQRLADRLVLHDAVTFHGWKAHHDTRSYFETADLLLVSSRFEGEPFVLHEAATAGVPAVGTAVGDLIDWAPEAALTVDIGDANALADRIALVLRDEAHRYRLARAAQARALAIDVDASAARIVELYDTLAHESRAGRV